jgi:branched-chain amino acid transport system permease protein
MAFFFQVLLSGVGTGAIYGLIAAGYSLTYTTTKTFNFALGMWVMLAAMLTYTLNVRCGVSPVLVLVLVMTGLAALGVLAERISIAPFVRTGSDLWVMGTLAVGFLLIDIVEMVWGRGQNDVPSYLGDEPFRLGSAVIRSQDCLSLLVVTAIYLGLHHFYRNSMLGKVFRAVSHDREVSQLMGINIRRVEILSYASSAVLAGIAGFLIVPITGAEPHLGTGIGLKAFSVAIIAGLSSPKGILLTALVYGAFESVVSGYVGTGVRDISGFALMVAVLAIRPHGLFGRREGARP